MSRYSTSLIIKKYKLKHKELLPSPIKTVKMKKTDSNKCWLGCGTTDTLINHRQECKIIQLTKTVLPFLINLIIYCP